MNAERWASEQDSSQQMYLWLDALAPARTKAGRRSLRLFACGCVRLWWDDLTADVSRRAVEVAEEFADGRAGKSELARAHDAARTLYYDKTAAHRSQRRTQRATYMAFATAGEKASSAAYAAICGFRVADEPTPALTQAERLQCDLFRCVFGNPFKPPVFNKKWRSETVTALATGIYADHAFDRLPILADALEEAGCDDPAMLVHLRGPGPHCRGCWVLDLALGK